MRTLHITGFADFLAPKSTGMLPNTSRLLVEAIQEHESLRAVLRENVGAEEVRTHVFPMPAEKEVGWMLSAFRPHLGRFLEGIDQDNDAWLALGQGAIEQKAPRLEHEFKNVLTMGKNSVPILPERPFMERVGPGLDSTRNLVNGVRAQGENLEIGVDAGSFNCNWVGFEGYESLGDRARFVHLQTLCNGDYAAPIWAANKDIPDFRTKVPEFEDLTHATVWDNYRTVSALLKVWRPFDVN